jgi:hypothetical protein
MTTSDVPRPVESSAAIFCCVRRPRCFNRIVATVDTGRDWAEPDLAVGFDVTARVGGKKALAAVIRTATSSGWIVLDVLGEPKAYCPEHEENGLRDERRYKFPRR